MNSESGMITFEENHNACYQKKYELAEVNALPLIRIIQKFKRQENVLTKFLVVRWLIFTGTLSIMNEPLKLSK